jgi:hypothetical protein
MKKKQAQASAAVKKSIIAYHAIDICLPGFI